MKKKKTCDNNMSRTQKRLLEKQLKKFATSFNSFSLYQLGVIRDLIDDIIQKKGGVSDD